MNIGIVCYPTFGGSGVLATELGKALAVKNHTVHFITYQQPVRLTSILDPNIFYHEVRVPDYPLFDYPPYEVALASTLVDVILTHKLNLLHVHYAIPHASAALLAKQIVAKQGIRIPVVTTLHGTDITLVGRDKTYTPVVTFSINESDAVTAVSESLKQDTFKHFEITNSIDVIHNFVDIHRFNKKPIDIFKKLIAPEGEKIIVHASNFRKVKRVDDVIKIFHRIQQALPAKLLMVGDGPERTAAEDLAKQLGIIDHIRFLGKQEQIEEILAIGDIFLLPSESESFGLSALEAMAAHMAVISSNAGGISEINIHNQTGFLSNIGDVESMAELAIYLLKNEPLLAQFKTQAYAQACRFDTANIIPQYEKIYARFCPMMTC